MAAFISGAQLGLPARAATTASAPGYDPTACGGALTPPTFTVNGVASPIVIASDNDWDAAHGVTGGSGTTADPYVIGCWSINMATAPTSGGTGISVGPFALDQAFVIRDVVITGSGPPRTSSSGSWYGISLPGPGKLGPANAVIDHATVVGFDYGIQAASIDSLQVVHNQVANNVQDGVQARSSPALIIDGNSGSGNGAACIYATGTGAAPAQVTNNACTANPGDGFYLNADTVASANVARGNAVGFFLSDGATVTNNTVQGNANGLVVSNQSAVVVTGNTVGSDPECAAVGDCSAEVNRYDGIDITSATGSLISGNLIVGNGTAGIQADPANTNAGFWGWNNQISNNRIGGSPYGIVFFGPGEFGNVVQGTTWTDGHQSVADFAGENTVVDAGSAKVGKAGQPVLLSDYIAQVTVGSGPPFAGVGAAGLQDTQAALATQITWNCTNSPAGPVIHVTDPTQGHGPPPTASCTYAASGGYTALLQVTATTQPGQMVTYSATVPVTIS